MASFVPNMNQLLLKSNRPSHRITPSNRLRNIFTLLTILVIFLVVFCSLYIRQYNYRNFFIWSESESITVSVVTSAPTSAPTSATVASPTGILYTDTTATDRTLLLSPSVENILPVANSIAGSQFYVTSSFQVFCNGGGISNKVYKFASLYGIARTLNRVPFVNLTNDCIVKLMKEMTSFFPQIARAMEFKVVSEKMTKNVDFAGGKCCHYEDVGQLFKYNSSQLIALSGNYLQSFKFFDKYKSEVIKLFSFTDDDIAVTDKIAMETFQNDSNHKICVHIRRGDYTSEASIHLPSTENFTKASVLYVREKLLKERKNSTVALLGDDRSWAKTLFAKEAWARVPNETARPTTDYAFVTRHCQTVILSASASTFGFWSAYLSSAENIYYNVDFAKSDTLKNEFTPNDVFPPTWISLSLTSTNNTNVITEVPRSLQ
jgi:hypothetical protein